MRWISFPDGAKLSLSYYETRPKRNEFQGPLFHYRTTNDQALRAMRAGQTIREWAAEAIARGEEVEIIWPDMEEPPDE